MFGVPLRPQSGGDRKLCRRLWRDILSGMSSRGWWNGTAVIKEGVATKLVTVKLTPPRLFYELCKN